MRTTVPTGVVIVVPARNEADTLPACLASLQRARAHAQVPTRIVVVLDDSTDASASMTAGEEVVTVRCRNVGAARAAGFEYAGATDPDALLLCT
ncbi:glycosyltransferase family 2 protein, partial [Aldersonia kunmingensis]|uniref:glycosyltransferase family 2 protein n=1 Tax=Aldersonia kunmingensis TaxID=408066 RepID=UPI0012EE3583